MPCNTDGSLYSESIGSYKLGAFYSSSFSGEKLETELASLHGVGREGEQTQTKYIHGGVNKTLRLVILLHEASHFVHDLSLGACLNRHYLLDLSSAIQKNILRDISKNDLISCPLFHNDRSNVSYAKRLKEELSKLKELEDIRQVFWSAPKRLNEYCHHFLPSFSCDVSLINELDTYTLLEGLVAAKVLQVFVLRIKEVADIKYLEDNKNELGILPKALPRKYNIARDLYYNNIGRLFKTTKEETNLLWPTSYSNTACSLADLGLVFLADIALHIPPFHFIHEKISKGENTIEDFIPSYRFCKAINCITKAGAFPPMDTEISSDYYDILFDYIASQLDPKWPTFSETQRAWSHFFADMKNSRKEATDGYSLRLVVRRTMTPTEVVLFHPLIPCGNCKIPVFHLTPNCFKILQVTFENGHIYLHPDDLPDLNIYKVFNTNFTLWQDTSLDGKGGEDDIDTEIDNQMLFLQETIYRSFCYDLHSSILYKNSFSCPFWHYGCSNANKKCAELKSLAEIPQENCALRDYFAQDHIDPTKIKWI